MIIHDLRLLLFVHFLFTYCVNLFQDKTTPEHLNIPA
jgi:hypothetical protein